MKKKLTPIDAYISRQPKEAEHHLKTIRLLIKKLAPLAEETIAYGVPTFVLNGYLVHFGAAKKHLGFYPTSSPIIAFKKELRPYKYSRGAVQFPYDRPLPLTLITRMLKFRLKQLLV